jgi:flagellar biogenesis protein FliO
LGGILAVSIAEEAGSLASPEYLWSLIRMLGALLLVCALAFLLLRGLRRLAGRRSPGGAVRVIERCPLSPRHSLWVVEVGDRCFLLGGSDGPGGSLTRLAELDRANLGPPRGAAPGPAVWRSFREILGGPGPSSPPCGPPPDGLPRDREAP